MVCEKKRTSCGNVADATGGVVSVDVANNVAGVDILDRAGCKRVRNPLRKAGTAWTHELLGGRRTQLPSPLKAVRRMCAKAGAAARSATAKMLFIFYIVKIVRGGITSGEL